jgi:hypothetical protein
VGAIASLAIAGVLYAWKHQRLSERVAVALLSITALFELGTVTGQGYRHRETPGGYLHVLEEDADIASFLRRQPDFVRLDAECTFFLTTLETGMDSISSRRTSAG